MRKQLTNQETRVMQYLISRQKIATENVARITGGTYKQGANLLLRMHKDGILVKLRRGVYAIKNKENLTVQSEIKFRKPRIAKEKKQTPPELLARLKRMRDIREKNRQERIIQAEEKKLNASRTLVGYKLIKLYPHSAFLVGDVVSTEFGAEEKLETYPELWQPIYKVIKPEPKPLTDQQKSLIQEAKEYVKVAEELIKKAESLNNLNN